MWDTDWGVGVGIEAKETGGHETTQTCPLLQAAPVMLEHLWVLTPTRASTALRDKGLTIAP